MIEIRGLDKTYRTGSLAVHALRSVDLIVTGGEFVSIMGPSGSGKTTLMNLLGALDRPTGGLYRLAGEEVSQLDDNQLADVRNRRIGFVFQSFNLLPKLTALENVELPLMYRGIKPRDRHKAAVESLTAVGLANRLHHQPKELSGGQMQRVAVARALAGHPDILLADEPTGNLDSRSGEEVMLLFQELNRDGATIVVVTHDERIAAHTKRVVRLRDGRIVADESVANGLDAALEIAKLPPADEDERGDSIAVSGKTQPLKGLVQAEGAAAKEAGA
ncbi:MAG: ABC transporter ATP-binding protein [Symbiobacteriia bacterium]